MPNLVQIIFNNSSGEGSENVKSLQNDYLLMVWIRQRIFPILQVTVPRSYQVFEIFQF